MQTAPAAAHLPVVAGVVGAGGGTGGDTLLGMESSDATVLLAVAFSLLLAAVVALGVLSTKQRRACLPWASVADRYAAAAAPGAAGAGAGADAPGEEKPRPADYDDDTEAEDGEYDDTKTFPLSLRDSMLRWLTLHRHHQRRGSGSSSRHRRSSAGGDEGEGEFFDVEQQHAGGGAQQGGGRDGGGDGDDGHVDGADDAAAAAGDCA